LSFGRGFILFHAIIWLHRRLAFYSETIQFLSQFDTETQIFIGINLVPGYSSMGVLCDHRRQLARGYDLFPDIDIGQHSFLLIIAIEIIRIGVELIEHPFTQSLVALRLPTENRVLEHRVAYGLGLWQWLLLPSLELNQLQRLFGNFQLQFDFGR
jgi:hypothetical protein